MKKAKRKKLPTLRKLQAKADRLWREMILADGTGACQVCRDKEAVSAHHIFHKGAHGRARYDRRNGLPICIGCHLRERFDPAPVVFAAIVYHRVKIFDLEKDVRNFEGRYVWNREKLNLVIMAMTSILEDLHAADPASK